MPSCYDAEYNIDRVLRLATVSTRLRSAACLRRAVELGDEAFRVSAPLAGLCPGPRRGVAVRRALTPASPGWEVLNPLSQ